MKTTHKNSDVLLYNLYKGSKTKQFKMQKVARSYIVPLIIIFIGGYRSHVNESWIQLVIFLFLAMLLSVILTKLLKKTFERHYKNFINKNLSEMEGSERVIEINNDKIIYKNIFSETFLNIPAVKDLIELKNNYIISINDMMSIILPKNDESKNIVETVKSKNNLEILDETKWKW